MNLLFAMGTKLAQPNFSIYRHFLNVFEEMEAIKQLYYSIGPILSISTQEGNYSGINLNLS